MRNPITYFINTTSMYRMTLYVLSGYAGISILFAFFGVISYPSPWAMIASLTILIATCEGINRICANVLQASTSVETSFITALILFFLLAPPQSPNEAFLIFLAGTGAILTKYLFAWKQKHIFNPAAMGAVFSGLVLGNGAIWWIATPYLLPVTVIGGLLVVKKIRRTDNALITIASTLIMLCIVGRTQGTLETNAYDILAFIKGVLTSWPIIFFATIMAIEPATSPTTKKARTLYSALAGILFALPLSTTWLSMTPELALVIANLFAFTTTRRDRTQATLIKKELSAKNTFTFTFKTKKPLTFSPGQYLEWTLPHKNPDNRGTRRYFTLAGCPDNKTIKLGVKIEKHASSFKRALGNMRTGDVLSVAHVAGDFLLPKNPQEKIACIAGGIGITPFISMVEEQIKKQEKRDMVLFACCTDEEDFAYRERFHEAKKYGLKYIEIPSAPNKTWTGASGRITKELMTQKVPDFATRTWYLSGPSAMVNTYKRILKNMGIKNTRIKTDYFPGL